MTRQQVLQRSDEREPDAFFQDCALCRFGVRLFRQCEKVGDRFDPSCDHGARVALLCALGTTLVGVFTTDPLDTPLTDISTAGTVHMFSGMLALMLLPFAALLLKVGLVRNTECANVARRMLLWTAGLPRLAFVGFAAHLAIFVLPLSVPYGPGVPLGWPVRIVFLTYTVWVIARARVLSVRTRQLNHRLFRAEREVSVHRRTPGDSCPPTPPTAWRANHV